MTTGARCVVFDIDDTLYLERDYVRSGFRAIAPWVNNRCGVTNFDERAWEAFQAGARGRIFDETLQRAGVQPTPELIGELVDRYRRHSPDIELLPDARRALDSLQGRFALAGLTDGPVASQKAKARVLGLESWIGALVFTWELGDGMGKPNPEGFRMVERSTGTSGSECVYVADNPAKDFLGPRTLGWRTIRVRRPEGLHSASRSGPDIDLEMPDLTGLASALGVNK